MNSGIYLLTNNVNSKSYIGQTWDFHKRMRQHRYAFRRNSPLANAVRKYGGENFTFKKLIVVANQEDMDQYEKLCIEKFNTMMPNGYNISVGGRSRGRNFPVSQETRERMSALSKGHKRNVGIYHSEETKEKLRSLNLGRKHTEETKAKISLARAGRKLSEEHKLNISKGLKGITRVSNSSPVSDETKKRMSDSQKSWYERQTPERIREIAAKQSEARRRWWARKKAALAEAN